MRSINRKKLGAALFMSSLLVILLASGLLALAAAPNPQPEKALFFPTATEGSLDLDDEPTILRTRSVGVNLDVLAAAEVGDTLVLNLFEDAIFNAVLDRKETTYGDGYAWTGHVQGQTLSQVTLVVGGGQIAGNVSLPGAFYRVRYAGDDAHAIQQIDQAAFPPEMEPAVPEALEEPPSPTLEAAADACADIDVMVVWTAAARTAAGGTTAMENLVNLAVVETNQSYINSGLVQRISLAHMEEVSYAESGDIELDLDRLTGTGDGYMDNVHALRDTHYADLVSLFIEDSVYCGVAWTMTSVSTGFESAAFSVVRQDCATGYYSFGHEMGHNMGARHDWYVDDSLDEPYSYNKGYVNVPDVWRTVMAYNTECALNGVYCTRLPYWSNPDVLYDGDATGVPVGTSTACVAGDLSHPACDADNRLTLNNTCSTVANFRDEPGGVGPLVFDDYTVDDDDLDNSSGNDDGYVDCGETIELYVDLYNEGADTASAVTATLSTSDPYVSLLANAGRDYGDIAGGTTAVNLDAYDFEVDAATPHGHVIAFSLAITASNGGPWSSSFEVPVFCLSADSYEPDNDDSDAKLISSGVSQTHNIYPVGDEDWVFFTLAEESGVVIETSGPAGDTRMWLYDDTLNELDFDDDSGDGLWSYIDRVCGEDALPAGTFYVKVDDYGDNDPIAEYDLTYTLVGPCAALPEIDVDPSSFSVILPFEASITEVLTISNLGEGLLDFVITDTETSAPASAPASFPLEGAEDSPLEQPPYPGGSAAGSDSVPTVESLLLDALWLSESPDAGTVDPAGSATIVVTFDSTGQMPGVYTADIIIDNNDPDEDPTIVPVTMEILTPPSADLEVTKADYTDPVIAGSPVLYALTVTNHGPEVATNVVLSDTLPTYAPLVSVTPGSPTCSVSGLLLTCDLGDLPAGSSTDVEVVVLAPQSTASLLNVASVTSDLYDADPGNNLIAEQTLAITEYVPHNCDQPGNPVSNCSFEIEHLYWITQALPSIYFPLQTGGPGIDPGYGLFVSAPTHGNWATLHDFDGEGPGWIRVAQDVNLSATAARLVFDYRAGWDLLTFSWPGAGDRFFHVNIEPVGGGTPLQTTAILSATMGTFIPDTADLSGIVDLSDFAGMPVRISFDWYVPDYYSGPGFFQLDNVLVEEAPPVPDIEVDPALIDNVQPADTVEVLPLTIGNIGGADLTWSIHESPLADLVWRDLRDETQDANRVARSGTPGGSIIDNGLVMMGVHEQGHLNVPGPDSSGGVPYVGLRYMPTNAEATAPGAPAEGWGVADAISDVSGYANENLGGAVNLSVLDFVATPSTATSVVQVGSTFTVSHEYRPSPHTPNLYEVVVTVHNISPNPTEVLYRRVMDWDIEPTIFNEFVTIQGTAGAANVTFASDDGFAPADPLASPSSIGFTGDAVDDGPADHGALFDFNFGLLDPGQSLSFTTFYGAAATESEALSALAAVGAEVYSLGQPNTVDGPTLGTPNTFIFGLADGGGTPLCTPGDIPWASLAPSSGTTAPAGESVVDVTLDSTGLAAGTYSGNLCISSNDPDEPVVLVPVSMEVVPPATQLYIEPSYAEIPEGGTYTVDVMVSDVADLYGAALELTFDPAYVQVVDHDPGTTGVQITPGSCPAPDFIVDNSVDNGAGLINYDVTALSPSPACNGTGVIASITLQGIALSSEFPLHFSDWLLVDSNSLPIPAGATDGTLIVVPPPSTLLGYVYLQGRTDHSGAEICAWDGGTLVDCTSTTANGYYELPILPGTYDVTAAMDLYLDSERSGEIVSPGPHPLPDVTLLGGDTNDDCVVNILDLTLMGSHYNLSTGDTGWDERADINADGTVNIQDLVLGGSNYLKTCPVPWP